MMMFARIYRTLPFFIGLAVIIGAIYLIVRINRGSTKAKEVTLRITWWICCVGTIVCVLGALWAWLDGSWLMTDMWVSCVVVMLVFWAIDLICAHLFKKHHENYRLRPDNPHPKVTKDDWK